MITGKNESKTLKNIFHVTIAWCYPPPGTRKKSNYRGDLKFKCGAEQFSWHQEFHFLLCLKIFVCYQK